MTKLLEVVSAAADSPCPRFTGAIHNLVEPRVQCCAGTHQTGFDAAIQRTADQSIVIELLSGLANSADFCMRGGVTQRDRLITRLRYNYVILYDNGPNWYFAKLTGPFRELQTAMHIMLMIRHRIHHIFLPRFRPLLSGLKTSL